MASSSILDNKEFFSPPKSDINSPIESGKTPQYIIVCKEFFSSSMDTGEDTAIGENGTPCFEITMGSARPVTYDSSGELSGDGRILFRNTIIRMRYGEWAPKIQEYMFNGKKADSIVVHRMSNINGTNITVQKLEFETCLIKTYTQVEDSIIFSFCFLLFRDIKIVFGTDDGTKSGQIAVQFDVMAAKGELKEA